MLTHKQLRVFEAKSADTRISRDQPTVARLNFSLANGEGLVVEVPHQSSSFHSPEPKRAMAAARRSRRHRTSAALIRATRRRE